MTGEPRRTKHRVDADGVKVADAPGLRTAARLLLRGTRLVAVAVVVAIVVIRLTPGRSAAEAPSDVTIRPTAGTHAERPAPEPSSPRPTPRTKTREPAPGEERRGIAVFPPPVRHYQVTDDGRRLPAILMFHPDYEFVDERGNVVPLPEDRVVPVEMAPPGLPIKMLEVRTP